MKNILADFMNKEQNIFTATLDLLGVKHTKKYTNKYFNEHPDKYNMFGLAKMLEHYGIHTIGVRTDQKDKAIGEIDVPFIAHLTVDFVAVETVSKDNVTCHWQGGKIIMPIVEFMKAWSGAILLIDADKNAIEPEYKAHRQEELNIDIQKGLLFAGIFLLSLMGFIHNHLYSNIGLVLLFLLNLTGLYIGYLLVLKQMHIQSKQADKICSLFSKNTCNDILESPASKFMGIIGWSELGFSYFLANSFILLFTPKFLPYLALLNICALPYSFWSIWYQKFKAKTWCSLCIIVQVLFGGIFITNLSFGFVKMPVFTVDDVLFIGLIYSLPFLVINLLIPQLAKGSKIEKITQEFNSFKMNEKAFQGILKDQPYYEADKNTSKILFGNVEAKNLITVFTNPHCEPCGRMHNRIENFIKETDNYCIQYILSSFNEDLDSSCQFLLYVNNHFKSQDRDLIFNQWFKNGKYKRERMFEEFNFMPSGIDGEYKKHKEWKDKTKLGATPTIFINGHKLPDNYDIEDLIYFSDLELTFSN